MSNWALRAGGGLIPLAGFGGTTGGVVVTPQSTVAHTKEAWVEVIASTPVHASALLLSLSTGGSNPDAQHLVDVALGPAGSERIIAANIAIASAAYRTGAYAVTLPLDIPRGSRISIRKQASVTALSSALRVHGGLVPAHPMCPTGYQWSETAVVDAAQTSLAVVVQAYNVLSWNELIAATARRVRSIIVQYGSIPGQTFGATTTLHIARGASGAEQVLVSGLQVNGYSGPTYGQQHFGPIEVDLPAGTRLSAAIAGSNIANQHGVGLLLFG